jgi:hypothetical protein
MKIMGRIGLAAALSVALFQAPAVQAQTAPGVENQAAYVARCKRETIAAWPGARAQADSICQSNWQMIVASGPLAEALLAIAPATGTPFDATAAKARATGVRWAPRAAKGQSAAGRVGDVAVVLAPTPPRAEFSWFKNGEPIPFNLEQALRVRGVAPVMIGCLAMGAGEGSSVYRVTAPGKAPFTLTVARREAAVASQSSDFNVTADFSGRLVTLASLQRDGNDWAARCPA